MYDKGLIVASFGTSHLDTMKKTIAAVESAACSAFPEYAFRRAFTSGMIRKSLAKRGIYIPGVKEAISELQDEGIKELLVLPTHLICGEEYDALCAEVRSAGMEENASVARPLITDFEAIGSVLSVLDRNIARAPDEALVLMGHGTEHWCNPIYAGMNYYARERGFGDIFVGTVEAWPDLDTIVGDVRHAGWKKVVLTPLMLVAGDHAKNDMAGEWAGRFGREGFDVRCLVRGLGEYAEIRSLYLDRLREAAGIL